MKKLIIITSLLLSACSSTIKEPKLAGSCQTYFDILDANTTNSTFPPEKVLALKQDFDKYRVKFSYLSLHKQKEFCQDRLTRFQD